MKIAIFILLFCLSTVQATTVHNFENLLRTDYQNDFLSYAESTKFQSIIEQKNGYYLAINIPSYSICAGSLLLDSKQVTGAPISKSGQNEGKMNLFYIGSKDDVWGSTISGVYLCSTYVLRNGYSSSVSPIEAYVIDSETMNIRKFESNSFLSSSRKSIHHGIAVIVN